MKGNNGVSTGPRPALALALGYVISATAVFALVSKLGELLLAGERAGEVARLVVAVAIVVLVICDAGLFGLSTPMLKRQTPKNFMGRFGTAQATLLWGLDAGTSMSTYRVTSASLVSFVMTFFGVMPWWTGALLAAGFVIPELVFDLVLPRRPVVDGIDPEPMWVMGFLQGIKRQSMRVIQILMLAAAAVLALHAVVG